MTHDINILQLLLERKEEIFTIKKIAEALKINYRTAYEHVTALELEGLLRVIKSGNANVCTFAYKFNSKVYEAEFVRRNALFQKNKNFLILQNRCAISFLLYI